MDGPFLDMPSTRKIYFSIAKKTKKRYNRDIRKKRRKTKMLAKKKRNLIIIITSIILGLLIIIATLITLYLTTDMFKSNSVLFAKYIVQNI